MTRTMSCDTTLYALMGALVLLLFATPFLINTWARRQDVACPHCHKRFYLRETEAFHA